MKPEEDYIKINRESWNKKAEVHVDTEFYNVQATIDGESSLNDIELDLLGDVTGKSILHLQCHFGQDSISLARLGADVVGADLSNEAIDRARDLATKCGSSAEFVCCDVYDLPNHLDRKFDFVFTTYGVIGWLPDMDKWAKLISDYLKPGGKLVFVEFHPVVWMFDDDFTRVAYNYFKDEAIVETYSGTYADKEADIQQDYVSWNHSLSEVMSALLNHGMRIDSFQEFDYSPYDCFNNTDKIAEGKYRIKGMDNKLPMVYAIGAIKEG